MFFFIYDLIFARTSFFIGNTGKEANKVTGQETYLKGLQNLKQTLFNESTKVILGLLVFLKTRLEVLNVKNSRAYIRAITNKIGLNIKVDGKIRFYCILYVTRPY